VFCPLRPASPLPKLVVRVVGLFAVAVLTNRSEVVLVGLVLSLSILPRANLIYDSDITNKKQVKCRSVNFSGTCKENAAAQWRLRMTHALGSKSVGSRHCAVAIVNKKNINHHETSEIRGLLPLFDRWISAMLYGGNIPLQRVRVYDLSCSTYHGGSQSVAIWLFHKLKVGRCEVFKRMSHHWQNTKSTIFGRFSQTYICLTWGI